MLEYLISYYMYTTRTSLQKIPFVHYVVWRSGKDELLFVTYAHLIFGQSFEMIRIWICEIEMFKWNFIQRACWKVREEACTSKHFNHENCVNLYYNSMVTKGLTVSSL